MSNLNYILEDTLNKNNTNARKPIHAVFIAVNEVNNSSE